MTSIKENAKLAVLTAIKKDDFTASEIMSGHSLSDIAEVITEILYEKRIMQDSENRTSLSDSELQNIYLLARSIISKNMIDKKNHKLGSNKRIQKSKPLISQAALELMYQLRPVH